MLKRSGKTIMELNNGIYRLEALQSSMFGKDIAEVLIINLKADVKPVILNMSLDKLNALANVIFNRD